MRTKGNMIPHPTPPPWDRPLPAGEGHWWTWMWGRFGLGNSRETAYSDDPRSTGQPRELSHGARGPSSSGPAPAEVLEGLGAPCGAGPDFTAASGTRPSALIH